MPLFYHTCLLPQMAPKKRQSLAESRRKIEAERVNVELRKTARIKKLYADAGRSSELVLKVRKQKVLNKVQLTNCWLGSSFPTGRRTRRTCPSTFPWTHQHFQPIRIKCHVYTFIKISIYQPMVYIYIIFSNLLN